MIKLLLEHGADVNMRDANGHTPLHIASLLNAGFLIPMLLHAGADTSIKDNRCVLLCCVGAAGG